MYKTHLAYIQGADSMMPTSVFYSIRQSLEGYKPQPFEVCHIYYVTIYTYADCCARIIYLDCIYFLLSNYNKK